MLFQFATAQHYCHDRHTCHRGYPVIFGFFVTVATATSFRVFVEFSTFIPKAAQRSRLLRLGIHKVLNLLTERRWPQAPAGSQVAIDEVIGGHGDGGMAHALCGMTLLLGGLPRKAASGTGAQVRRAPRAAPPSRRRPR